MISALFTSAVLRRAPRSPSLSASVEACERPLNQPVSAFRRAAPQADAYVVFMLFTVDQPTKTALLSSAPHFWTWVLYEIWPIRLGELQLIHHLQGLPGFEWGVKLGQARFLFSKYEHKESSLGVCWIRWDWANSLQQLVLFTSPWNANSSVILPL